MSRQAPGSAFGKVILVGEHAVVYGGPAIAVAIERGAEARATTLASGASHIRAPSGKLNGTAQLSLDRALRAVLEQMPAGPAVRVDIATELPPGAGLGCSAAIGVAVTRALDPRVGIEDLTTRAMAWERVFHGNPSGVDVAVSSNGGCIRFQHGFRVRPLPVIGELVLCIGHTGLASSTKVMVEAVAALREQSPALVGELFEQMAELVGDAERAIGSSDRSLLGRAMNRAQELLDRLMVSNRAIDSMCEQARAAGAVGAKLTGAGGGGCVVALASDAVGAERVIEAWRAQGREGFVCIAGSRVYGQSVSRSREFLATLGG
jgi:mevalonate kinase